MTCKGRYRNSLFHRWERWELVEREKVTEFFTGSMPGVPAATHKTVTTEFFQFQQCSRCDKRKTVKL